MTTGLITCVRRGDWKGTREHLEEVGIRDDMGLTALMCASDLGDATMVKLLLPFEGGLQGSEDWPDDTLFCDDNSLVGITALMLAARKGHYECVSLLVEREKGLATYGGITALMYAAATGHADLVPLLQEELGMEDECGNTALMNAALNGQRVCVSLLLSELGHKNKIGWTALMYATQVMSLGCVELLMGESGQETHEVIHGYPAGTTALIIAAYNGYAAGVELLVPYERGRLNSKGESALLIAMRKGYQECASLLLEEACMYDSSGRLQWDVIREQACSGSDQHLLSKCYRALSVSVEVVFFQKMLQDLTRSALQIGLSRVFSHVNKLLEARTMEQELKGKQLCEMLFITLLCETQDSFLLDLDAYLYELEGEDVLSTDLCCICLTQQPDLVLLPCHHLVLCSTCGTSSLRFCPYCRSPVASSYELEVYGCDVG
ncbi:Ankyrin repeat protein 2 [Giardia muris]|uniref:Ankyrin repeat protein 2 n=1 Tax=Giardia muris TaxID=5742 RepID=A0A4Z1SV85_GIAMU|nr:Ankyrin repeat protein 2 [Giardia muris]|eukprot:TNJ28835.1 Ankyrin repeat protein 2 [Giardia muris]